MQWRLKLKYNDAEVEKVLEKARKNYANIRQKKILKEEGKDSIGIQKILTEQKLQQKQINIELDTGL